MRIVLCVVCVLCSVVVVGCGGGRSLNTPSLPDATGIDRPAPTRQQAVMSSKITPLPNTKMSADLRERLSHA